MSIVKDTISITAITLVAGLALGVVQDITADPIAEQKMKAKQEAYKSVFWKYPGNHRRDFRSCDPYRRSDPSCI